MEGWVPPRLIRTVRRNGLTAKEERAIGGLGSTPADPHRPPEWINREKTLAERMKRLTGKNINACPRCNGVLIEQPLPDSLYFARSPP